MKKLVTLAEHNEKRASKTTSHEFHYNGIACPVCGKELYDSNPEMLLLSHPPKLEIACYYCGYNGLRIA
jgi:DNA-directed RNA polymerase subunit RPC12/RpoP